MKNIKYKLDQCSFTEHGLFVLLHILKFEINSYIDYGSHKNGRRISSVDKQHKSQNFRKLKVLLKIKKNIIYHLKLKSKHCKECIEDHSNPTSCNVYFGGWCDKKMKLPKP